MTQTDSPLDLLSRALDQTGALIAQIRPGQETLPTPCRSWDVRALVNHVVDEMHQFAKVTAGGERRHLGVDVIGEDWSGAYREAAQALLAAWRQSGALEQTQRLSIGEVDAGWAVGQHITELSVHAWDIAKATGQPTDLDPELGQLALDWPATTSSRSSAGRGGRIPDRSRGEGERRRAAVRPARRDRRARPELTAARGAGLCGRDPRRPAPRGRHTPAGPVPASTGTAAAPGSTVKYGNSGDVSRRVDTDYGAAKIYTRSGDRVVNLKGAAARCWTPRRPPPVNGSSASLMGRYRSVGSIAEPQARHFPRETLCESCSPSIRRTPICGRPCRSRGHCRAPDTRCVSPLTPGSPTRSGPRA